MFFDVLPNYATQVAVAVPQYFNFWNFDASGLYPDVYSGVRFGSDGKIHRMTVAGNWQWTGKMWLLGGDVADFYLKRTVLSGAALATDDGDLQQMNANLDFAISTTYAIKSTTIEFSISDDTLGSNLIATGSYQLGVEKEFNDPNNPNINFR